MFEDKTAARIEEIGLLDDLHRKYLKRLSVNGLSLLAATYELHGMPNKAQEIREEMAVMAGWLSDAPALSEAVRGGEAE